MPTSCCTSSESAWLLMRAEARGLSGILIPSTPTDFRKRAPSTSLRISVPLGGTISTMVTNSPLANLAPIRERSSSGMVGPAEGAGGVLTPWEPEAFARAPPTRSAAFMTRICSGVVPQHSPTIRTPAATNFRA